MRIVIASDWFSEKVGYMENLLPRSLAELGHEVHVITTTGQVYFTSPDYEETYGAFLGPALLPQETKELEGFMLHRLPPILFKGRIGARGFAPLVRKLAPDIVQTTSVASLIALQSARSCLFGSPKLFTANHIHASVFPAAADERRGAAPRQWLSLWLPGRLVGGPTEICYAISPDAADIAVRFLGTPKEKVLLTTLGVDTTSFHPIRTEAESRSRRTTREDFGWDADDVVAVYSGRLSEDKDPLVLARAVSMLRERGEGSFRCLFIGTGPQGTQIERMGFPVLPFVPYNELPSLYRACDIGVWPRQESTSMLDAAAVGLPLVVSDRVQTRERVDGNGHTYAEGDAFDLADALARLADPTVRARMGDVGARKMAGLGWLDLAEARVADYERALSKAGTARPSTL